MFNVKPVFFFGFSIVFLIASLGWDYQRTSSPEALSQEVSVSLTRMLDLLEEESNQISEDPTNIVWSVLQGSHFLVDSLTVLAWSKDAYLPDVRSLQDSFDIRLIQVSSGDYIIRKRALNRSQSVVTVLTLYQKYPIVNKYLSPQWNQQIFGQVTGKIGGIDSSFGTTITYLGNPVFKFEVIELAVRENIPSFLFASLSLMAFLTGILVVLYKLHHRRRFQFVFLMAALIFVLVRILMVQFNFPGRWLTSKIFSPQEFASSAYNASLGDMVLNSLGILLLCWYCFYTYSKWSVTRRIISSTGAIRWGWCGLLLLMGIFSFLYPFLFFETLFHNSFISLDITQTLSFDILRSLAFISVIFGTISAFLFTHIFIQIAKSLAVNFWHFGAALLVAGAVFITYFLFESRDYWLTLAIVVPYLIVLYLSKLGVSLVRISYITFLYFFFAITAFGIQGALSVRRFVEEERIESQFRFATSYLIDRDVLAEYLLNESVKRISTDAFIASRFASPFLSKSPIRQKVKQVYLNSYFDRYDVRIHLLNSAKEPVDDQTPAYLSILEAEFTKQVNTTEYAGIFFIRSQGVQTGKRYFTTIPVTRFEQVVGFVVLDLSLKRIIPQNVYPELLVDNRFNEYFENRDKSFAFISEQNILSSFGNFNYERDFDFNFLESPEFYREGIRKNGFIHTGIEDESGRVAVVTSLAFPVFYILTNFSFFFVLGIFVLGVGVAVYGVVTWLQGGQIKYAARIQLYIYLAFAIPLLIVTVTTLNRVSKSAEDQLNQDFQNKSRLLGENLALVLAAYFQDPENGRGDLETQLVNVAKFSNVDISVYDPMGRVIATSQPVIIENQISSGRMNRYAWERIFQAGDNTLILNEKIGSLRFNNSYFGLKSPESASLIGVLSVPFFESALSLEATQISVLANILTVFTIIFILFSILSFFVVDSLTFPLRFITRTLSRTTLTGTNTPLKWKSNDEIGLMVTEYNRMVENLEESKIELARSQKESAWREIAKQVAHEIKNPLTPMKLTLQQMEQSITRGELDKARTNQSIKTLLSQVEILNEIASSFSAFARMPAPILQRIELVALIRKSVDLYANYEGGSVSLQDIGSPLFVMGDDQLLNRIFSNIILNALQSGEGQPVSVKISLQREPHLILISFVDNGKGIDDELKEKIFAPYFSTKKSGSGLGLAIAKQGIEQSGGAIWFESIGGGGSTFYIRLPLA